MDYISIGVNIVIAIIVSIITAKLSIRGFYRQEIWLRKEKRYSQIIEQLNILQKHFGDWFDECTGINKNENDEIDVKKNFLTTQRELELVALDYVLIINNKVSKILKDLFESSQNMTEDERMGDESAYTDRIYGEIRDAKEKIIKIAKTDLKL